MRPIRVVRAAIAVALVAVSFISFPSFLSAGLFTVSAPAADRMFKGDGLPLTAPAGSPMIGTPESQRQQSREKVPIGCEGAFSPIASPRVWPTSFDAAQSEYVSHSLIKKHRIGPARTFTPIGH